MEGNDGGLHRSLDLVPLEYIAGAMKWLDKAVDGLARCIHPILGSTGRETVRDLPPPGQSPSPGCDGAAMTFRTIRLTHEWTIDVKEVLNFDVDSFLEDVNNLADEFGGQLVSAMVEHISEVCESRSQTINAEGRDFFEVLIEVAETMELTFDEDGRLQTQLLLHPDTYARISERQPTAEQEMRLRSVIDRKREEWNATRRRCQLPEISE
ncbi:hypothetical protein BayCH28_25970 [Mycolicibacterium sp. CH28]|uniref:hypothetical protein n=1 Tax=Mycolicibacterium sp. CH28 TaxID=2512237 RepID=UPI0010803CA7|nr:hypothetical protein [Mycolicibacterium sp. CH28]TGD84354.1 hypothetical protein BayCH28_25970 [Mycolicibacterium sp. CH28]